MSVEKIFALLRAPKMSIFSLKKQMAKMLLDRLANLCTFGRNYLNFDKIKYHIELERLAELNKNAYEKNCSFFLFYFNRFFI